MKRFTKVLTGSGPGAASLLAMVFLAACASRAPLVEVEKANAAYTQAAEDQDVARYGSVQLYEAKKDLDEANSLAKGDAEVANHKARLAITRIDIARSAAATGRAREETAKLFDQRDKLLLEARTVAAERALAEAGLAKTRALTAEERARAAEAARKAAEASAKTAQMALSDLQGQQTERGYVLTLGGDILFDTGKSAVNPGAMQQLFRVVTFLRENTDRQLLVEGHTDAVGSDSSNQALSQRRAESVAAFLIKNGIAPERVVTRGYGESRPIVGNETPAGRQQNRRVEIVILNPGESASQAAAQEG